MIKYCRNIFRTGTYNKRSVNFKEEIFEVIHKLEPRTKLGSFGRKKHRFINDVVTTSHNLYSNVISIKI